MFKARGAGNRNNKVKIQNFLENLNIYIFSYESLKPSIALETFKILGITTHILILDMKL